MNTKNQLYLQLVINKLLELDTLHDDVSIILRKALNIILKSPISNSYLNKGIIMLVEENGKKLKLVAYKNILPETVSNCKNIFSGECVCGITALSKKVQYINNVEGIHNYKSKCNEHAYYSLPILYNKKLYGVLTINLAFGHQKNNEEIEILQTVTKTLALIIYKKKELNYNEFIKTKLDNSFGTQYFKLLAKFFAKDFGMKYCLIGRYDAEADMIKTIVFVNNQRIQKNFSYQLNGTPCKTVIEKNTCFYPNNVQQLFPNDDDLKSLGVESYLGVLLKSEKKVPIGLIAFMHDKPIDAEAEKKEAINLFLPRLISECERKNYEDKLIQNENKYKAVFDNFQDIFIRATLLTSGESIITEVSKSIFKFSGYTRNELIGRPSSMFYHSVSQRNEMFKHLLKNKFTKDYPLTLVKKNGQLIFVLVDSQLVFEKDTPIEIRIVARDVTEKRNEEIRKEISYLIAKKTQRRITNIRSLSEYIYHVLGNSLDTSNFHIVLANQENKTIDFQVFVDQKINTKMMSHSMPIKNGLIEYIIDSKTVFIKTEEELKGLIKDNYIVFKSPLPKILISFPLKSEGIVVGLLTVKSYKNVNAFSKNDIDLLDFTATQLSNIIEKEQWQKSLIDKEKYFRSLVESSLEVTGIVDENGKINYMSESVNTILGYPAYHLIGKYFYNFIPTKYSKQAIEHFKSVVSGKKFQNPFMVKVVAKNNIEKIIQFSLNNQLKNLDIKGVIFNAHDITEKHLSEKKLKKSQTELIQQQDNYKTIFNNANDGIIRIDKKFKIIESNRRMTKILGYSKKELINQSIYDITEKQEIPLVKNEMAKLTKNITTNVIFEKHSIHRNGKQVICKVYVKSVFTKEHKLDYFIAFITDVTKREEAIKRATELESALDKSANILYVDKKGFIIHVGSYILCNTGYTKKELIGKHTRIFNSGYHSSSFFKEMWETVSHGNVFNGEVMNKKKDGSNYWIFATIIPIKNLNNEVEYYINVRHDITEYKQAKIDNIKDVIDAQEKEKENFARELHDGLGQMLLASKMNLNAIKSEIDQLDTETIEIYNNSLKLLTQSIQEARTVSHGLMSRVLNQFGLAYAVNDMIKNNKLSDKNIIIEYIQNIDEERFDGEIEKGLYRVLQELTSNIFKHSEATEAKIEILKINNELNLKVTDNGVGVVREGKAYNSQLGIGLKNIETRIHYLSGTFCINEKVKKGTEINIMVPVVKNILVI